MREHAANGHLRPALAYHLSLPLVVFHNRLKSPPDITVLFRVVPTVFPNIVFWVMYRAPHARENLTNITIENGFVLNIYFKIIVSALLIGALSNIIM